MDRSELKEIKKGETGKGILIEHDGYIDVNCGSNKKLFEAIGVDGMEQICPEHFIVDAVFQKYGIKNANGRIYPENVLKREVDRYMNMIREKTALGELNHPSESVIDLSRVALNIVELHWEGATLVGKLEIITSPGYRKHGIISCQGDQMANLILSGLKIGVSSRGLGTVTEKFGTLYVSDDYEILCWDCVSQPSTNGAWIGLQKDDIQQYVESKKKNKPSINEELNSKLSKFEDWLND